MSICVLFLGQFSALIHFIASYLITDVALTIFLGFDKVSSSAVVLGCNDMRFCFSSHAHYITMFMNVHLWYFSICFLYSPWSVFFSYFLWLFLVTLFQAYFIIFSLHFWMYISNLILAIWTVFNDVAAFSFHI